MANIPVNANSIYVAPGENVTGMYAGFIVLDGTIISSLKDANYNELIPEGSPLIFSSKGYIPLFVTRIAIDASSPGGVILNIAPQSFNDKTPPVINCFAWGSTTPFNWGGNVLIEPNQWGESCTPVISVTGGGESLIGNTLQTTNGIWYSNTGVISYEYQ